MDMGIKHLMEQAVAIINTSTSVFKQSAQPTQIEMFPLEPEPLGGGLEEYEDAEPRQGNDDEGANNYEQDPSEHDIQQAAMAKASFDIAAKAAQDAARHNAGPILATMPMLVKLTTFEYLSIGGVTGKMKARGMVASGSAFFIERETLAETSPQDVINFLQEIIVRFG